MKAELYYRLLVKPIGEYLKVPQEELADRLMNQVATSFELVD